MIYAYFVNYCEPAIRKESFVCGNTIKAYIPPSFITIGENPLEVGDIRTHRHIYRVPDIPFGRVGSVDGEKSAIRAGDDCL